MDRSAEFTLLRRSVAFVIVVLPLALLPATCPGETGGDFGRLGPLVWLELLAAGLLGGALMRGWSGAVVVAGAVAAGMLVFAAAARPAGTHPDRWMETCGLTVDPGFLLLTLGPGFVAVALIGYGVARSVARSVGDGGRLVWVSPGRLLIVIGALAWLLAQFLPAWTYGGVGESITEAGITFTVWPLGYAIAGVWYFVAWAANLLLGGAWWLAMRRAAFGSASLLSRVAAACAALGVALQLNQGANEEVAHIGTFVWCASFAVLALGLAARWFETRRVDPVAKAEPAPRAPASGSPATPRSYSEK